MGLTPSRPYVSPPGTHRTYPMPASEQSSSTVDPAIDNGTAKANIMADNHCGDDFVPASFDENDGQADAGKVMMDVEKTDIGAAVDDIADKGICGDDVLAGVDGKEKGLMSFRALPEPSKAKLESKGSDPSPEKCLSEQEKKLAALAKHLAAQQKKLDADQKKAAAALEKQKTVLEKKERALEKKASQEKKVSQGRKGSREKMSLHGGKGKKSSSRGAPVERKSTAAAANESSDGDSDVALADFRQLKKSGSTKQVRSAKNAKAVKSTPKKLAPKKGEKDRVPGKKLTATKKIGAKKIGSKVPGLKRKDIGVGQENFKPAVKKAKTITKMKEGSKAGAMKKRKSSASKGNAAKKENVGKNESNSDSDDDENMDIASDREEAESGAESDADDEDASQPVNVAARRAGEGIACSSSDGTAVDMVTAACKQLRGFSPSSVEYASVFVRSPSAKRTPALLLAIARGIPVLTIDWLTESITSGRFIKDFSRFESHEGAKASRKLKKSTNSAGFLRRTRVKIVGKPIADTKLLESIIVASGGRLVSRNEEFSIIDSNSPPANHKNPVKLSFLADAVEQQRMLDWGEYLVA